MSKVINLTPYLVICGHPGRSGPRVASFSPSGKVAAVVHAVAEAGVPRGVVGDSGDHYDIPMFMRKDSDHDKVVNLPKEDEDGSEAVVTYLVTPEVLAFEAQRRQRYGNRERLDLFTYNNPEFVTNADGKQWVRTDGFLFIGS